MLERLPIKDLIDDAGSLGSLDEPLPPSMPDQPRHHHFPTDLYRHSQELKAEQFARYTLDGRMPRPGGSFTSGGPMYNARARGLSNSSNSYSHSRDSNADLFSEVDVLYRNSNSFTGTSNSFTGGGPRARRREEIIGLRITIYNNAQPEAAGSQTLEGIIVSYDDITR